MSKNIKVNAAINSTETIISPSDLAPASSELFLRIIESPHYLLD